MKSSPSPFLEKEGDVPLFFKEGIGVINI